MGPGPAEREEGAVGDGINAAPRLNIFALSISPN